MNKDFVNAIGDCYPTIEVVNGVELLEGSKCLVVSYSNVDFVLKEDTVVFGHTSVVVVVESREGVMGSMYLIDKVTPEYYIKDLMVGTIVTLLVNLRFQWCFIMISMCACILTMYQPFGISMMVLTQLNRVLHYLNRQYLLILSF